MAVESIGELAQRTGTSRRMLRHWEAQGLLDPAAVDLWTSRRGYSAAQAGRVRAIAALRAVGFGLETIRDLLDQGLSESRLLELLSARERELTDRIAQDSSALVQVQSRLRSLHSDRNTIMDTLVISTLDSLQLKGVTETVADETEIPDAVARLLAILSIDATAPTRDVVLAYDGTTDTSVIVVSAAEVYAEYESTSDAVTQTIDLPPAAQAAIACFAERPNNTADAWIALDAALGSKGLRATGPYRHTVHADGRITLATPITTTSD